jgi:hypothetical protein
MLSPNDALILAAVVAAGGSTDLDGLIGMIDYLDRSVLAFDELSHGLARLRAEGWITVTGSDGFAVAVTDAARQLVGRLSGDLGLIEMRFRLADALPASARNEDPSLGRLPELREADFRAATARYLGRVPPRGPRSRGGGGSADRRGVRAVPRDESACEAPHAERRREVAARRVPLTRAGRRPLPTAAAQSQAPHQFVVAARRIRRRNSRRVGCL